MLTLAGNGTSRWLLGGVVVCVAIGALSLRSWTGASVQPAEFVAVQPEESNEPIQPIDGDTQFRSSKSCAGPQAV